MKKQPAGTRSEILQDLRRSGLSVIEEYQAKSCEGFASSVFAKVTPLSIADCQTIVEKSLLYRCPIYPTSTGKNWGFGTEAPPKNGCILMDLSRLNKIIDYDEELGTACIQPGVTQIQLANFLKGQGDKFRLDVTGSGEETSVLGNTLERGVGYKMLRHESLISLKILLMDGTFLETGYARFSQSKLGKCLAGGIGPAIKDVFTQSNFGIVLEATVKLQKLSSYQCAISYSLENDSQLLWNMNFMKELLDEQIISCIPKIADKRRCEVVFCSKYFEKQKLMKSPVTREQVKEVFEGMWGKRMWTVLGLIAGPASVVKAKQQYIQERLNGISKLRVIDKDTLKSNGGHSFNGSLQLDFDKIVYGYATGIPSNDSLMSTYWDVQDYDETFHKPEDKTYGFIILAPVFPNTPKDTEKFLALYRSHCETFNISPALTLNHVSRNAVEAVISISFKKSNIFEVKIVQNFREKIQAAFIDNGFLPYRLDTASTSEFYSYTAKDQGSWNSICGKLKSIFDPNDLLSPGRYS